MGTIHDMIAWAGLTIAAPASAQQAPPDWLVGKWCTEPANGKTVCETWQPMGADQIMHGTSETRRGEVRNVETMRIVKDGGRLVFHAEPPGQAPADFHASGEQKAMSLVFDNPAHDYPQRVRYWREGELLMAEISLIHGGKPMRWIYRRMPQ